MTNGESSRPSAPAQHVGALAHELLARHHLRHDEAGAEPMREAAERQVGHAGHGREQNPVRRGMPPDREGAGRHVITDPVICLVIRQCEMVPFIWAEYEVAHSFRKREQARPQLPRRGNPAKQAGAFLAGATMTTTAAVIVAAGRGTRAAAVVPSVPKQYASAGGRAGSGPLAPRSDRASRRSTRPWSSSTPTTRTSTRRGCGPLRRIGCCAPVAGRRDAAGLVLAGLEALGGAPPDRVLDPRRGAPVPRPPTSSSALIAALDTSAGAIAAEPVSDTLKRGGRRRHASRDTVDRAGLWRAQTPQAFRFAAILDAHRRAAAAGRSDFTDDAGLAEWAGLAGQARRQQLGRNMKLTTRRRHRARRAAAGADRVPARAAQRHGL